MKKIDKAMISLFFKYYFTVFISICMYCLSFLYVLSPSYATFRLYILSTAWLSFAGFLIIIRIFKILSKFEIDKHEMISSLLLLLCYIVAVFFGPAFNLV